MTFKFNFAHGGFRRNQKGITTLAITLILLVIVTMMVLFSSNVGFFEQKTTTNENRARIAQQAAEYALNLAGEYLKANRDNLISDVSGSGWLATTGTSRRWAKCADAPTNPACLSERDPTRRAQLYFWTSDGTKGGSQSLLYKDVMPVTGVKLEDADVGTGGDARFTTTTNVRALLCRLDTSLPKPDCRLEPVAGNRVALYVIADAALTGESGAKATVKETWASISSYVPSAAVPLVASGYVKGLGNGQIIANPNAGGYGLPGSIWSPKNASIDGSGGGGVGSFSTCYVEAFLKEGGVDVADLKSATGCAKTTGSKCACGTHDSDWMSGHVGGSKRKGMDILDVAVAGETNRTLPSITFFPGGGMDKIGDDTDDSLFEYIFNPVTNVVADHDATGKTLLTCGDGTQNCFDYAMREEFNPTIIASCSSLGPSSSGIFYVTGPCLSLPAKVGSPDSPAIVVVNQGDKTLDTNQNLFYGMLFLHSDNNNANVTGKNTIVFGALVVEGEIDKLTANFTVVYDDTAASSDPHKLPKSAKFARVPGSWLDASVGF